MVLRLLLAFDLVAFTGVALVELLRVVLDCLVEVREVAGFLAVPIAWLSAFFDVTLGLVGARLLTVRFDVVDALLVAVPRSVDFFLAVVAGVFVRVVVVLRVAVLAMAEDLLDAAPAFEAGLVRAAVPLLGVRLDCFVSEDPRLDVVLTTFLT